MSKIIKESYDDIQEIEKLAIEILRFISDKYIGLIYELLGM